MCTNNNSLTFNNNLLLLYLKNGNTYEFHEEKNSCCDVKARYYRKQWQREDNASKVGNIAIVCVSR